MGMGLHRIERREAYHDDFRFSKLEGYGNLTIQVGSTAYLHCPVVNLGERPLSWVRRRDWAILSHGQNMFIQDDRFQLAPADHITSNQAKDHQKSQNRSVRSNRVGGGGHTSPAFGSRFNSQHNIVRSTASTALLQDNESVQDWILMIKHVQANDSGSYECQVTLADGGVRSHQAELKVETPEAFILADEEYHIDTGSSLSLVCIIEKATEPPAYVFWYHNDRMVNYDSERGISVTTTPGRRTHSQLSIKKAVVSDSGNYTCAPARSLPASIQVFVAGSEVKPWTSGATRPQHFFTLTTFKTASAAVLLVLPAVALSSLISALIFNEGISGSRCSSFSRISGYPAT